MKKQKIVTGLLIAGMITSVMLINQTEVEAKNIVQKSSKSIVGVTRVKLDLPDQTMVYGQETQLTATVSPSNATNKNLVWSSFNEKVVTVSKTGLLTAKSDGSTNVVVTTADGMIGDHIKVTVKDGLLEVTDVTLSQTAANLNKGATLQLKEAVFPNNATIKTVSWKSSNENVAKVSSTGLVTAIGGGKTTITVETNQGAKVAKCELTVAGDSTVPVSSVTVLEKNLAISLHDKKTVTANVLPANATNKQLTWSSTNPAVATVSAQGEISAKKVGTAKIVASSADGKTGDYINLTVEDKLILPTSLTLSHSTVSLNQGQNLQLKATVLPSTATNKHVIWESSNNNVAKVSDKGFVTTKGGGTAVITAKTALGDIQGQCLVTVNGPIAISEIKLPVSNLELRVGQSQQVTPTINSLPAGSNSGLLWSSTKPTIAQVSKDGIIVGKKVGKSYIIVTSPDGMIGAYLEVTIKR